MKFCNIVSKGAVDFP